LQLQPDVTARRRLRLKAQATEETNRRARGSVEVPERRIV
jgi:hypothetical protein